FREAGVNCCEDLKGLKLEEVDALANSFHRWAVGYAVCEGGAAGSFDIPAVVAMALRTVRGIGTCYGFASDTEAEREFILGIISAAGANSRVEKTSALLFLRQL